MSAIAGVADGLTDPHFAYDANGNLTCVSTGSNCAGTVSRTVTLTAFNMAGTLTEGSDTIAFTYDSDHARVTQTATVGGVTTVTTYVNDPVSGAMALAVSAAGTLSNTDYLSVDGQIVAQRVVTFAGVATWGAGQWNTFQWGSNPQTNWGGTTKWGAFQWSGLTNVAFSYFTLDHLGSVAVVTDAGGAVVQRLSYDPWGKQRNPNGTPASCGSISSPTTRGFTNQEQVPGGCLVNLNARLYDPEIGRMMAPDPVVGSPFVPQQLNRYTYVLNNPLSLTDPTGLCFLGCFWHTPLFREALAAVLSIALPEFLPGLEITAFGTAFSGTVNLGIAGGITGYITTGKLSGALLGGLQAVALVQIGQPLASNIAEGLGGSPNANLAGAFIAKGLIGGLTTAAGGGPFGAGFLSAGVGSLAAGSGPPSLFGAVRAAILGGFASTLGGGKFANGAITAAFSYAAESLGRVNQSTTDSYGNKYGPVNNGYISCGDAKCYYQYQSLEDYTGERGERMTAEYLGQDAGVNWIQTYSDDGAAFAPDCIRGECPFYYNHSNTRLDDTPRAPAGNASTVLETSLVRPNQNGGYDAIVTFRWGFQLSPNSISLLPPQVVSPSAVQLRQIRSAHQ